MLTAKQQRFVEAYVANPNGAQAAIRAGYSARTARVIASENLRKPEIADAIDKATETRQARENIRIEKVREQLARIAYADITGVFDEDGQIRDPSQWPDELKRVVKYSKSERVRRNRNGDETARVVTRLKVEIQGQLRAMDLLAESLGMFPGRSRRR